MMCSNKYEVRMTLYMAIAFSQVISCAEPAYKDAEEEQSAGIISVNQFEPLMTPTGQNNSTPIDDFDETSGLAGTESSGGMEVVESIMIVDPPSNFPDYAIEMLEYVNNFRSTGGQCGQQTLPSAPPLSLHELLNESSRVHAEDMAVNGYFDHHSQDGRTPGDRIAATGYRGSGYGENIAAGQSDALSTFQQWKDSPGHCINMLRSRYNELGVGYHFSPNAPYRHYWVQNFSTR